MNYRHAYHAGNFADVFKHSILLALLDALIAKDKPLCCFDTHAGRGAYRLDDAEARTTGEWREGIGRLWNAHDGPGPLRRYVDAVRACNPASELRAYPGSPLLAAQALRANDRLLVAELLVQPDNSPLRFNGCGMLIANPPWRFDATLSALLPVVRDVLAQSPRASQRMHWLRGE